MNTETTTQSFTPRQMLLAINDHSTNLISKMIARKVLLGLSTTEQELEKNHGRFMTSVLKGDFETALETADSSNKEALLSLYL